jgi:hypothetical protein
MGSAEEQIIKEIHDNVGVLITRIVGHSWARPPELTIAAKHGNSGDIAMLKLSMLSRRGFPLTRLSIGVSGRRRKTVAVVHSTYRKLWGERRHPCLLVLDPDLRKIKLVKGTALKDYLLTSFSSEVIKRAKYEGGIT